MAEKKGRKMTSSSLVHSEAGEDVANIEELLTQILQSMPLRSLARFKCVSKHWNSLITNLRTLKNPKTLAFVSRETDSKSFKSYPIDHRKIPSGWNPFKTFNDSLRHDSWLKFNFRDEKPRLRVIQSCNGLFLCCVPPGKRRRENGFIVRSKWAGVYVVNPTTQKIFHLSSPTSYWFSKREWERYALAFEPSKSPHYTLVCMMKQYPSVKGEREYTKIHIYSSKTREWKHVADMPPSRSPDCRPHEFDERSREGSVYCNGAVHWIREKSKISFSNKAGNFLREQSDVLHYFDIGEERFRVVAATPPVPMVFKNIPLEKCRESRDPGLMTPIVFPTIVHRYFGECSGRLYLIEIFNIYKTQFDVMEMERDYSGWFVKYHVDLDPEALPQRELDPFVLLCLSCDDEEFGDSSTSLLLHLPGTVVSYNLMNKNFKTSSEFFEENTSSYYFGIQVHKFPYMESLAYV